MQFFWAQPVQYNLTIDPVALQASSLRTLADDGDVVFQTQVDESLYDLLTKRYDKAKRYTPHAVETFKQLAALAGLPIHDEERVRNTS